MQLTFVTGSDKKYFLLLGSFLESFEKNAGGHRVLVCDFGLSGAQKKFLESRGMLLPLPGSLTQEHHHFYKKAALIDYLGDRASNSDAVVWIDSDTVVLNPIAAEIGALVRSMQGAGEILAICQEASFDSIRAFADGIDDPSVTVQPFLDALQAAGAGPDRPYLNTGFFVCRSAELLREWRDLTFRVAPHLLNEQNMMNVLAASHADSVRLLDNAVWNAHGRRLDETGLTFDPGLDFSSRPIRILHATSADKRHIRSMEVKFDAGERDVRAHFKSFGIPELQKIHLEFASRFLHAHSDTLP